jgi:hypothetical protein
MTTTRRESLDVVNNSRIANRYAIPASVKEAMKYGPPRSLKQREQIVSAVHNAAPSAYTLHAGVTFTVLPCPFERLSESLFESSSEIDSPQAPTL